jgi:hypothetical protein
MAKLTKKQKAFVGKVESTKLYALVDALGATAGLPGEVTDAAPQAPRAPADPAAVVRKKEGRRGKVKANGRKDRQGAPVAGAPCVACGGVVDRSGRGGYKRTVCAGCAKGEAKGRRAKVERPATPPNKPTRAQRPCAVCGEPFTPWRSDQKVGACCRGKHVPKEPATGPAPAKGDLREGGAPAKSAPASVGGLDRIKAALARVDRMAPAERNAAAAAAEAREAGGE